MVRPTYRPDIDGLRALAVLFVVAFHGFPHQFRGGFVGVDIFFTISGFLISTIIYQSLQRDAFSFVDFYARRARRIFPALIVVLVTCATAGWLLMLQGEFRSLGKNIGAAAAFVGNFAYFLESGYFDQAAALKPLLHLWSLGVEEQYYLVWPLLVVLSWRYRNGPLAIAAIVFAASFASNVWLVQSDPTAAFYLPLPRFWELMLGSALAFLAIRSGGQGARTNNLGVTSQFLRTIEHHAAALREFAAWIGTGLVAGALLLINNGTPFPGWWGLLPTLGTVLLIAAGQDAFVNRVLLSRPALVHIGLISYPLYLWHWPILSFERLVRPRDPTDLMRGAGIIVAFILAELTYRWIEKPIRFGASPGRRAVAVTAALAATGCLGLAIYLNDGFPQRLPEQIRKLGQEFATEADVARARGLNECLLDAYHSPAFPPKCDGGDASALPLVLLWGDSHSGNLAAGLTALQQSRGDFRLAEFSTAACPPILTLVSTVKICPTANGYVIGKIRDLKPETVILGARWEMYADTTFGPLSEEMIHATVTKLMAMGVKRIVVVGQFPVWQDDVPRILLLRLRMIIAGDKTDASHPDRAFPDAIGIEVDRNSAVQRALAGTSAIFVSPLATFCNTDGCLLTVPGSHNTTTPDNGHLSIAGSRYFVDQNAQALLGH